MSEEFSHESEGSVLPAAVQAKFEEYKAMREREYESALARLEDVSIEPQQHAAYAATLPRILALPLENVAWPREDPRFRLHKAIEYGKQLTARRADIDARLAERQPPDCVPETVYAIEQTALAALHAFKVWRANPEPDGVFAKLFAEAGQMRGILESITAILLRREWIGPQDLRHYDGGITVEAVACDLFLLAGVLEDIPPERRASKLASRVELMEATVLARSLMQHAARTNTQGDLWEPWVLYARALTLVDDASFQAELVLAELHNAERDPGEEMEWVPECLFCDSSTERKRHHRHSESPKAAQRRAQFVSSTMTAALRRPTVEN
jgi:hypothetical protein